MKSRNKSAIAVVFALMALMARPQIIFAQNPPAPIKGSWDQVKAIPPGERVIVRLRNKQKLSGRLISASNTVLTLEVRKNSRDVARGDALKVHRVVNRSKTIPLLIAIGAGIVIGAAVGNAVEPESTDDPGLVTAGLGLIGALIGSGVGITIGLIPKRALIYETN